MIQNAPVVERARFERLKADWKESRRFISSVDEMSMLPPYQKIIGMGAPALPFIFQEMQSAPDHWFWALNAITGEDPVSPEHRGNVAEMTRAWLAWARDRGYVK